jgi:hypothetical protein
MVIDGAGSIIQSCGFYETVIYLEKRGSEDAISV